MLASHGSLLSHTMQSQRSVIALIKPAERFIFFAEYGMNGRDFKSAHILSFRSLLNLTQDLQGLGAIARHGMTEREE